MNKKLWIITVLMVINIAGISCKPEVEVTVEKTKKLASGPQTEQVNKNEYSKIYYVADDLGSDETGEGSMEKPWASIHSQGIKDEK